MVCYLGRGIRCEKSAAEDPPQEAHKVNSPWNIAADFKVEMSFSKEEIKGMLRQYENDWDTGMDVEKIAGLLYDYTSGYPFLVSRLCKIIDEDVSREKLFYCKSAAWTEAGFHEALRMLMAEKIPCLNPWPES